MVFLWFGVVLGHSNGQWSFLWPSHHQVVATNGDTHLGGEDFDQRCLEECFGLRTFLNSMLYTSLYTYSKVDPSLCFYLVEVLKIFYSMAGHVWN